MRIDLHTHSNVSDGTDSPAAVVAAAAAVGLDVVALTDHDSMAGLEEASAEADRRGIEFVPGIEVSCSHRGVSVHLLAYWPDPASSHLAEMMRVTREARVERLKTMVELVAGDYPITWESVVGASRGSATVGRPHVADALVAAGVVEHRDEAFTDILGANSKYYVPHYAPEVHDATRALRAAGGVPVFAHPGADGRGRIVPTSVIESMAGAGLVGLEIDHRDHDDAQRTRLTRIAARFALVPTGSSDYHGTGKRNELGENLTSEESYRALQAARA